jgi:hypothetical protein
LLVPLTDEPELHAEMASPAANAAERARPAARHMEDRFTVDSCSITLSFLDKRDSRNHLTSRHAVHRRLAMRS